jgi:ribosomal protein L37E
MGMTTEPIYVVCERCGIPVETGVVADFVSLADPANKLLRNKTRCTQCGRQILWARAAIWPESVLQAILRRKG